MNLKLLLVAMLATFGLGGPVATSSAASSPLVVIMLENKTYNNIVGSSHDPYIQSLINKGTLFTNYQADRGSLPDYLENTSGLNSTTAAKGSDNIFNQLQNNRISWGEYEESMPGVCFTGTGTSPYDKLHNPAVHYTDITSDPSACANVVPYNAFDPTHLAAFSYVVPNNSHNMHDGATKAAEITAGDNWLNENVPAMLANGAEVIITWDEGTHTDEHVATIGVGGGFNGGFTDNTPLTHYGLLAGLEQAFGVPLLHQAQTATVFPIP